MNGHRSITAVWHRVGANDEGQALIEYALILGFVALLTIGVLQLLGQNVSGLLGGASSGMSRVLNS